MSIFLAPIFSKKFPFIAVVIGFIALVLPWYMNHYILRSMYGMATVPHFVRIIELVREREYFKDKSTWYCFLFVHFFHDLRQARVVSPQFAVFLRLIKEVRQNFGNLAYYLFFPLILGYTIKQLTLEIVINAVFALSLHLWIWNFGPKEQPIVWYTVRWGLCVVCLYHGLFAVDLIFRCSLVLTCSMDVPPIHNRPILSKTLKEFWSKRWNVVIQTLLATNIFFPLAKRGYRNLGLFATFFVSGFFHIYPLLMLGLSWWSTLSMFTFFIIHLILLRVEKVFGLYGSWWLIPIMLLLSPLFMEPIILLFTDGPYVK